MKNIQSLIKASIRSLYGVDFTPDISPAPKPELGEYCIGVFQLTKPLSKAPNTIAAELATELAKHTETFTSINSIGGYVNFFLTDSVWLNLFSTVNGGITTKNGESDGDTFESGKNKKEAQKMNELLSTSGTFDANQSGSEKETIVVDYIGMNVGKPPHIGHICTPLQGQAIINTLKYVGYRVIGDSHLGDWGSLFGKLIVGFRKYGSQEKLKEDAINHLLEVYIAINADTESDTNVEQSCRDAFRELSNGNPEYTSLWAEFTNASITTSRKILELMHIHQDYDIGESFYEGIDLPKIGDQPPLQYDMNSIVEELIEKGIAMKNDDGSVGVIFPEETKMPSTILRKKDGTNLYLTSDLAAIKYRLTNGWNPSKILYFVDVRQSLHLKQAFWIAKETWPELTKDVELYHAANGAIVLPEGAMSTRKGNIIRLDALVDAGFIRVKQILEEKGRHLDDADITEITIGSIKYSYLSQDRERDVVFTWDKALNFEGNSGPYIQYAYVRGKKIVPEGFTPSKIPVSLKLSLYDKSLIQILTRFDEVIYKTTTTYKPHHIALYAYELAVIFNGFYVHTPKVLEEQNNDTKNFRLMLIKETTKTIEKTFGLLGIKMPSEM